MYCVFFFQAETGIRDVLGSRGLGDVYKRQTTGVSNPRTDHLPLKEKCTAQLKKEPLLAMDGGENQETSQFHLSQRVE